ncbi:hypothetical protein FACS1894179_07630 [Bacteroidia bacterium]|nr:hypothetical protein FACS1894179_07630 [Bacteroidia bacterium]
MVMENKKKKGKPAKGEDKLTISINLELTQKEYKTVKEKAEILGIKPTQYAREMTINGGVKSRFTLEELNLMRKLAEMANNLNQVAKRVNRNEFLQVGLDLVILASKIKELVDDR